MLTDLIQVDWALVATRAGYNSANTAKTRYGEWPHLPLYITLTCLYPGQIKKAIGYTPEGLAAAAADPATPIKSRVKKESTIGSGTNKNPSKVKKAAGADRKPKVKVELHQDHDGVEDEDDEVKVKVDESGMSLLCLWLRFYAPHYHKCL